MRNETVKQSVQAVLESLNCTYSKVAENDTMLVYRLRDIWNIAGKQMSIFLNYKSDYYNFSYTQTGEDTFLYVPFKNNRQLIIYLTRDIVSIWKRGKRQ